jgi:hypothetical protein
VKYLVRLDLARVQSNSESATGTPMTDEDVLRLLATRRVWRRDEEWWTAEAEALSAFGAGEVLETQPPAPRRVP